MKTTDASSFEVVFRQIGLEFTNARGKYWVQGKCHAGSNCSIGSPLRVCSDDSGRWCCHHRKCEFGGRPAGGIGVVSFSKHILGCSWEAAYEFCRNCGISVDDEDLAKNHKKYWSDDPIPIIPTSVVRVDTKESEDSSHRSDSVAFFYETTPNSHIPLPTVEECKKDSVKADWTKRRQQIRDRRFTAIAAKDIESIEGLQAFSAGELHGGCKEDNLRPIGHVQWMLLDIDNDNKYIPTDATYDDVLAIVRGVVGETIAVVLFKSTSGNWGGAIPITRPTPIKLVKEVYEDLFINNDSIDIKGCFGHWTNFIRLCRDDYPIRYFGGDLFELEPVSWTTFQDSIALGQDLLTDAVYHPYGLSTLEKGMLLRGSPSDKRGGFREGTLSVVAAQTETGKSDHAIFIARRQKHCIMATTEMEVDEVGSRLSIIGYGKGLHDYEPENAVNVMIGGWLPIEEFISYVDRYIETYGVNPVVIIDNLNAMGIEDDTPQNYATLIRTIKKEFAEKRGLAVVAFSQLKRTEDLDTNAWDKMRTDETSSEAKHKPTLRPKRSDIKYASVIEQTANYIIMLWRRFGGIDPITRVWLSKTRGAQGLNQEVFMTYKDGEGMIEVDIDAANEISLHQNLPEVGISQKKYDDAPQLMSSAAGNSVVSDTKKKLRGLHNE